MAPRQATRSCLAATLSSQSARSPRPASRLNRKAGSARFAVVSAGRVSRSRPGRRYGQARRRARRPEPRARRVRTALSTSRSAESPPATHRSRSGARSPRRAGRTCRPLFQRCHHISITPRSAPEKTGRRRLGPSARCGCAPCPAIRAGRRSRARPVPRPPGRRRRRRAAAPGDAKGVVVDDARETAHPLDVGGDAGAPERAQVGLGGPARS